MMAGGFHDRAIAVDSATERRAADVPKRRAAAPKVREYNTTPIHVRNDAHARAKAAALLLGETLGDFIAEAIELRIRKERTKLRAARQGQDDPLAGI